MCFVCYGEFISSCRCMLSVDRFRMERLFENVDTLFVFSISPFFAVLGNAFHFRSVSQVSLYLIIRYS
jgi:hypothetical protein